MPTVNNRLTATLVFKYSANELNSHNPPTLELWRSTNNGTSWRRQGGVVDTANKTITKTGIVQFSRWTASDTSHLLGPAAYEWMPDSLLYVAGDTQKTYRHKSLQQPLVIRLKDYFNNWLEGDTVDFGFAGNSKGATLSILKAIADSNGYASTTLTLGDSLGVYTVVASNSKIPGRTIRFNATAIQSRVAVAIQLTAGNSQPPTPIYTSLSPFVVTTVDSEALPTSDDTVYFSIVSTPLNATGQSLSDTMVITDTIGQASTILKLGNKVGTYMIRATSRRGLIGSPITFTARAISGPPTTATLVSGNNQVKLVGDTLINPLVLSVADTGQNPVDSVYVKFAVASVPTGAQNYRLIADSVKTDSLGRASVRFILGTKPGFYTITARVANLTPMVFTARGFLPAVAIQLTAGNNQPATPILTSLSPFVVTAVDSEANPTIDDTVYFSIVSTPPNATGQSLSDTMVITDTIRQASTILRLGNKVGTYTIRATSRGLIGSPITFTARAIPGQPTTTALVSGNNQVKQIGDTLTNPLVLL
jgi:hypothetical protein